MGLKIQFDANQAYQRQPVQSVLDLFQGQPLNSGRKGMHWEMGFGGQLSELGFGNQCDLSEERILSNVQNVQKRNGLPESQELDGMNFSVEMETGTGKTYVYLRTIYELYQTYGFSKFIVVVPSVAIREGVLKNLDITREHFATLYGKIPVDYWVYDSKRVTMLRQFATANQLQIMVINIDAFNKDTNVINQDRDILSGYRPIEFIQETHPIVIVDEPQNMEGDQARAAIESLHPLCNLRYSATHRRAYNMLYRLDPVQAYQMHLVKRIEVDSVVDDPNFNKPYIAVRGIRRSGRLITAKLEINVDSPTGLVRRLVSVNASGVDLYGLSGQRPVYRGYVIDEIDFGRKVLSFTNGVRLQEGEVHGTPHDDIMRVQLRETVREHLNKELDFQARFPVGKRVKVLSLFFIDRVSNYAADQGKIRCWFEDAYRELAALPKYQELELPPLERAHGGYFAQDRHGRAKDTRGNSEADLEAYSLIMKDKERLLSPDEPLRFIFSHSALREGWDNPNVFQICTLNETRSEIKKRQEIGRGMRLPVNEQGERVMDGEVNRLTVVANEHYETFARGLQAEMEEAGVRFDRRMVENKRERKVVHLVRKQLASPEFMELWERIKYKTRYEVVFDTADIIRAAAMEVQNMPAITVPTIRVERSSLQVTSKGVQAELAATARGITQTPVTYVPDLIGHMQRHTELTRSTIASILQQSGRLADVAVDPERFLDAATRTIQRVLRHLLVNGIKYERVAGAEYSMLRLSQAEREGFEEHLTRYASRLMATGKSVYDAVEWDSDVEKAFAEGLEFRDDIRFYVKLPRWFRVQTPLGSYNPDWAIVKDEPDGPRLYLVRETKGTTDWNALDEEERDKIWCGDKHFEALGTGVDYRWVKSVNDV